MASNAQKYRINRVVDAEGNIVPVHPETDAGQVLYENAALGNDIKNVDDALTALADLATSSGVTGVKGAAESSYRKGNVNLTPANIGAVASNDAITAGTFTKVNVDEKGLVTGGSQATLDDIADGSTRKLSNYIPTSQKGANNGVATLGADGRIPNSQLPSYVDDVLEYENLSGFPTTGSDGKIYVDKQTNKTYRWSGSGYTEISASLALGETSSTAYAGDKGKKNADAIDLIQLWKQSVMDGHIAVSDATNALKLGGIAADQYAKFTDIPEDKLFVVTGTLYGTTLSDLSVTFSAIRDAIDDGKLVSLKIGYVIMGDVSEYYTFHLADDGDDYLSFRHIDGYNRIFEIYLNSSNNNQVSISRIFTDISEIGTGPIISAIDDSDGRETINFTRRAMQNSDLPDSGVTAGAYSAVQVNSKGVVTAGGKSIEWGTSGQKVPSDSLMVGGLFFELVE